MKIGMFAVVTPAQQPLREIFERSFIEGIPLKIVEIQDIGPGNGDFQSPSWYNAINRKQELVRQEIAMRRGEVLIVSDVDIQFFRSILPALQPVLDGNVDMMFQAELENGRDGMMNTGFIVMRCNEKVEAVYDAVLQEDLSRLPKSEQTWFNQKLKDFPVTWALLPLSFYAWYQRPGCPPSDIILHHANDTIGKDSLQQKLRQLDFVRKVVSARANKPSPVQT